MIWLWILAALLLSKLALGKKKISPEHYIWMLLPIDMYGIDVAGVTLKPYMIFSIFLLWLVWKRNDGRLMFRFDRRWTLNLLVLLLLVLAVNMFNTTVFSAVTASLMLLVVFACTIIYLSAIKPDTISQIPDVLLATAVGYGVVFAANIFLVRQGIRLPGSFTDDRMAEGIFMWFANMSNGQFVKVARLRGFMIDPNVLVCNFIYAIPAAVMNLATGRKRVASILALGVTFECMEICDSRMGILCAAGAVLVSALFSYGLMTPRAKKWAIGLLSAGVVAIVGLALVLDTQTSFFADMLQGFDDRSDLNGEYGRFTLWGDAINTLLEKNPLFGVGMGLVMRYSDKSRGAHNTWLEWLCGSGLLAGGAVLLFFVLVLIFGIVRVKWFRKTPYESVYLSLLLGVIGTVIALVSVDNTTNSYLWFGTVMLTALWTRFRPDTALEGG